MLNGLLLVQVWLPNFHFITHLTSIPLSHLHYYFLTQALHIFILISFLFTQTTIIRRCSLLFTFLIIYSAIIMVCGFGEIASSCLVLFIQVVSFIFSFISFHFILFILVLINFTLHFHLINSNFHSTLQTTPLKLIFLHPLPQLLLIIPCLINLLHN